MALFPVEDQNEVRGLLRTRNFRASGDLYFDDVARGLVPGAEVMSAYGDLTLESAETDYVVHPDFMDSDIIVAPAGGVQLSIQSTSNEDKPGGQGVSRIHLHYIDDAGNDSNEDIDLNGTTPVLTQATDIRFVQCTHIAAVGSNKAAVGQIVASSGGDNYSGIIAGQKRCSSSARMVPAGKRFLVKNINCGSVSGTGARCEIRINCSIFEGHDFTNDRIVIPVDEWLVRDGTISVPIDFPYVFPEGSVVCFTVSNDKSAEISASYRGIVEDI